MSELETLKSLKAQVESAISYIENGMTIKKMTLAEQRRYLLIQTGFYDLIVGDFCIRRIGGRKTRRRRFEQYYEKETEEKD